MNGLLLPWKNEEQSPLCSPLCPHTSVMFQLAMKREYSQLNKSIGPPIQGKPWCHCRMYLRVLAHVMYRFYLSWNQLVVSVSTLSALDSIGRAGGSYLWQTTSRRHSPHCILSQMCTSACRGRLPVAAVDRSLSLLSSDVFCVAAACLLTPTVDP